MVSGIANLVYELPHELPNGLRLRILGNKEILRKSQIWVETYSSTQSPFHKINFGNSSAKRRKSRYQNFLDLSSFTGFLYFVPHILSRIVVVFLPLVLNKKQRWKHRISYGIFIYFKSQLYSKQVSSILLLFGSRTLALYLHDWVKSKPFR